MFHKVLGAFMAGLGILMLIKLPYFRSSLNLAVAIMSSVMLVYLGARLISV